MRALCATHIEAMHNLQFLLDREIPVDSRPAKYLEAMGQHLACITDILCISTEQ
jgi:hypothetical protein